MSLSFLPFSMTRRVGMKKRNWDDGEEDEEGKRRGRRGLGIRIR